MSCTTYAKTNYPACDTTYAQVLGSTFDTGQIIYAVLTFVICVVNFSFFALIIKRKGLRPFASDTQKKMYAFASAICLSFIIRAVDPVGWRTMLPNVVQEMAYDWATCCCFSMFFLLVEDWTRIVLRISGMGHQLVRVKRVFIGINVLIWVMYTVFGLLQSTHELVWLWRAIKLASSVVAISILGMGLQSYVGLVIWRTLRKQEKRQATAHLTSAPSSSTTNLTAIPPTSPRSETSNTEKKRSKVNRILHLLIVAWVFEVVLIIILLVAIAGEVSSRHTISDPPSPPNSASDMMSAFQFDIAQAFIVAVLQYFFAPKLRGDGPAEKEDSKDDESSRSRRATTQQAARASTFSKHQKQPSMSTAPLRPLTETTDTDSDAATIVNINERPLSPRHQETDREQLDSMLLPTNWTRFIDAAGVPYFYNTVTKETCWELPK